MDRPNAPGLRPRPAGRWLGDRSTLVAAVFGGAGTVVAALYAVPGGWPAHEVALALVALAVLGAMAAGLRLNAPSRRGPWEVLFVGAVLLGLGGWVRLDRHTLAAIDAHQAFMPDLLVLVGSVLVAFAITVLARAPHPHDRGNPDMVLEALVAGVSAFVLLWIYLVEPGAARIHIPTFERCVLPISTSIDVYMVAIACIGIGPRARRSVAARALIVAVVLLTVADGLYLVADVRRAAVPHSLLGVGYILAATALGVGFLHPTMRRLFSGRWSPSTDPTDARDRLIAVVLAPGLLAIIGLTDQQRSVDQRVVLGIFAAVSVSLAAVRVWRAVRVGAATQARLVYQVTHDPLTGLGNRSFVERSISAALAEGARARDGVAVIFLDIDRFKFINDTHGYSSGDQLLIDVGERLTEAFERRGAVARVGGDEFAVVLFPVATEVQARREAELGRSTSTARRSSSARASAWRSALRPSPPPTRRRCFATPTPPCTRPRGPGATW
jgi:diguanylate cyclase (GGDEF)-like protein